MTINLEELSRFVIESKKNGYAADAEEIVSQIFPHFKEITFKKGDWEYKDFFRGISNFHGFEIVRFQKIPIWMMSYHGGMISRYEKDEQFAEQTFTFLKKVLLAIDEQFPFRGPNELVIQDWIYKNHYQGNIQRFSGAESIYNNGDRVYELNYVGGIIVAREKLYLNILNTK